MNSLTWIIIIAAAILSWKLLFWMVPKLRNHLVDKPNERSAHSLPIPRGGGISFVSLSVMSSIYVLLTVRSTPISLLPLFCAPIAIIGLIDDRVSLHAILRFSVHLLTALMLISISKLDFSFTPILVQIFCSVLTLITVTAVINFTNFMDGIDGLVSSCLLIAITTSAKFLSAPLPIWVLVGSLLGFLFWNWHPAKVFMGDIGSTYLGAIFAGLVLQSQHWAEALGLFLIATPILGDACICVIRRLIAGQKIFQAHQLHLYQRLHQAGWSQSRVTLYYLTSTILLSLTFLFWGLEWEVIIAIISILIGCFLDKNVARPFSLDLK